MPTSNNMYNYYKFVAAVWASDSLPDSGAKHPLIVDADKAATVRPADETIQNAAKAIAENLGGLFKPKDDPQRTLTPSEATRTAARMEFKDGDGRVKDSGARDLANGSQAWTRALHAFEVDVPTNRVIFVHRNTATEYHYVVPESPVTNPAVLTDAVPTAMQYVMTDG
jgi:hypothetical protein